VDDAVEVEGRTIRVIELDGRRISRLLVGPPPEPAPDAESDDERAPTA
jgi:putative hemolysin